MTNRQLTYPLLLLLSRPLNYQTQRMARLFVMQISMPPTLGKASSVEALETDENTFGVILQGIGKLGAAGSNRPPGRE